MVDYDSKLGEWFKQVEKKAEELRARKVAAESVGQDAAQAPTPDTTGVPRSIEQSASAEAPPAHMTGEQETEEGTGSVATAQIVEDPVELPRTHEEKPIALPKLFDESEAPQVEDFFTFLEHPEQTKAKPVEPKPLERQEVEESFEVETTSSQSMLGLSEGTGEPRPITPARTPDPAPEAEVVVKAPAPEPQAPRQPEVAPTMPTPQAPVAQAAPDAGWTRFPQQLQSLLQSAQEEVAQNSYKAFKESRAGLIERLLDPPLTLEEAARILEVCPTTVRRYTNRGILKHFRTAGNQRRFRLSDVLGFMESQLLGTSSTSDSGGIATD